jgi:hypothetical protein
MAWSTPRTWSAGETLTAANFNTYIRDQQLMMGPHLIVRKTVDESVTSSTTLQNDDVLLLPVGVNEIWQCEFDLLVVGSNAGDLKVAFTFPTGGTISLSSSAVNSADVPDYMIFEATTSPTSSSSFGIIQTSSPPQFISIRGVYVNGGTSGNVQLQWAQVASQGTATTVKANSTLWAMKLA